MDRLRYRVAERVAVAVACLCCLAACASHTAARAVTSPSGPVSTSATTPSPPPPALSFATLSADMLTAKDEAAGWTAAPQSGKLAGALDDACFTGAHLTPPGSPRLRKVKLTSPETSANIVTTVDQTLLVYPTAVDAISAASSLRTKFDACPPLKYVLPTLSNTSVTPAHTVSTKVTPTSIGAWQGFVAAHEYVLTGYGNRVGIANRTAVLAYSNAIVVISLDADVTHFTAKTGSIPSFDKADSSGRPYWQRLVLPFFTRSTPGT